jgi:hypothetical protein
VAAGLAAGVVGRLARTDARRFRVLVAALTAGALAYVLFLYGYRPPAGGAIRWLGRSILSVFEIVADLLCVWALGKELLRRRIARNVLGPQSAEIEAVFRRASRAMRQRRLMHDQRALVPVSIAALILGWYVSWHFVSFVAALTITGELLFQARIRTPAAALFLGSSERASLELYARLKRSLHALRFVALLDTYDRLTTIDPEDEWIFTVVMFDCLRTADDASWIDVVDTLIPVVPIIILDARFGSPAVLHEAYRLQRSGNLQKTIAISSATGDVPLLGGLAPSGEEVVVVRDAALLPVIAHVMQAPRAPLRDLLLHRLPDGMAAAELRALDGTIAHPSFLGQILSFNRLLQQPAYEADEHVCMRCGKRYTQSSNICPHCGSIQWFGIVAGILTGIALVLLGAFYCTTLFWKSAAILFGVLNMYNWGTDAFRVMRRRT